MPLQKQLVPVTLGSVDQKASSKTLQGRLTVAENVYQSKTRSYRKRGGWAPISRTTDTGAITTGADLTFGGIVPVIRTADAVYARPAATWLSRGAYVPVVPSQFPVFAGAAARPVQVVTGTQVWTFAQDGAGLIVYEVTDSGTEVASANIAALVDTYVRFRAVASTGAVWLFAQAAGSKVIRAFKFLTATPTVVATATVFANPGGVSVDGWDVIDAQANGNGIVVAVLTRDAGGIDFGGAARGMFLGRLDTATGLVDGTGWVGDASVGLGIHGDPVSWVRIGQSATLLHLLWRRQSNGHIYLTTVTAASLVSASVDTTATLTSTASGISAYREAGGNVVMFLSDNAASVENSFILRASWTGAALTSATFARAHAVTSDPFVIGSKTYIVTQHDDTQYLQNAYYVMDATASPGRTVARSMYQLAGAIWSRADRVIGASQWDNNVVAPVSVSGNVASLVVGQYVSNTWSAVRLSFDFASSALGPPALISDGQNIILPGGYPMMLSGGGSLTDLTLAMFPRNTWTVSGTGAAGTLPPGDYICNVVYEFVDARGNVERSVPSVAQTVTITAGQSIRFSSTPTLRAGNTLSATTTSIGRVFITFYITTADETTLFLVKRIANLGILSDTAGTVDIPDPPATGAEILYTDGGGLEHVSAPPCTWAATWRGRLFLGGTDEPGAVVWPSFELAPGFGPAFNEILRFRMPDGTGKDVAGCPLDFNYFVILKQDSVWLISGAGPDPIGIGSYGGTLQQVPDAPGCTNPRSVVQTPIGVMYQARNGEVWLVTPGGGARHIGISWDDHKGALVTAAVHSPLYEWVLLFTDSAKVLIWDYGNPLPEEGSLGQGYVWNLPVAAVAAAAIGSDLRYLDATGVVRGYTPAQFYDDTSTPILRKCKAAVTMGGLRGYQRLYRGQVVGQYLAAHSLKVTVDNFAGVAGEVGAATQSWTKAVSAGPELFEFKPDRGRVTAMDITIEDVGTDLTEGATLDGLAVEVGLKSGLPRLNTTQRM